MVFYATRDGQSRRIAVRICERLAAHGIGVAPHDLAGAWPTAEELASAAVVVLVAAVRYGRHLPEARRFLARYRALAPAPALALASVNLTARKPAKSTAGGQSLSAQAGGSNRLPAGRGRRVCRTARLSPVWLARSATHPRHHVADGRADRSGRLRRVHRMGRGRCVRGAGCRIACAANRCPKEPRAVLISIKKRPDGTAYEKRDDLAPKRAGGLNLHHLHPFHMRN